jgi:hypothetical protein
MNKETFTHYYFPEEVVKKGEPLLHKLEIPIELEEKFRAKFGRDLLSANKDIVEKWLKDQK